MFKQIKLQWRPQGGPWGELSVVSTNNTVADIDMFTSSCVFNFPVLSNVFQIETVQRCRFSNFQFFSQSSSTGHPGVTPGVTPRFHSNVSPRLALKNAQVPTFSKFSNEKRCTAAGFSIFQFFQANQVPLATLGWPLG